MKILYLLAILLIAPSASLLAQTYASPELMEREENHIRQKNEQLRAQGLIPADFSHQASRAIMFQFPANAYRLVGIEAIDSKQRYTTDQMTAFQNEADMDMQRIEMAVDWQSGILSMVDKYDHSKFRNWHFEELKGSLVFNNCEKCNRAKMKALLHTPSELHLRIEAQDEDKQIHYIYKFSK